MICLFALAGPLIAKSEPAYEQAYVEKHQGLEGVAVPTEVVRPLLRAAPENLKIDVLVTVDSKGKVTSAKVLRSTDSRHNTTVVRAAKRWKFLPAQIEGESVPSKVRIPFVAQELNSSLAMR